MNRDQKAAVIEEVSAQIQDAEAVFAVDYRGISVPQAAELRTRLNEAGATFRVVKNTLTERAADRAGAEPLKGLLEGPTAFTFVRGDAAIAAKALAAFQRETDLLGFKGGTMSGEALSADEITAISRLPGRDLLQGQFVGVLASPLTGLVRGLASLISGLAIQLRQIEEKGLVGGEAPPAGEAAEAAPGGGDADAAASEAPGSAVAEAEAAEEETAAGETPDAEAPEEETAEGETPEAEAASAESAEEETSEAPSEGETNTGSEEG